MVQYFAPLTLTYAAIITQFFILLPTVHVSALRVSIESGDMKIDMYIAIAFDLKTQASSFFIEHPNQRECF